MATLRGVSARPITAALLVAGLVASLVAAGAATALGAAQNTLSDVQVGEKDRLMRIALVCEKGCQIDQRDDGGFLIADISSDLKIPLAGRSQHADALSFRPTNAGSVLAITASRRVESAAIHPCMVRGSSASCIDVTFAEASAAPVIAAQSNAAIAPVVVSSPARGVDYSKPSAEPATVPPVAAAPETSAKPAKFREAPTKPVTTSADVAVNAAPLSVPEPPKKKPSTEIAPAPKPSLRASPRKEILSFNGLGEAAPSTAIAAPKLAALRSASQPETMINPNFNRRTTPIDFGQKARLLLGRSLTDEVCHSAQTTLNEDAWALDAMVDVGFCKALAGDLSAADSLFARLLAYTPDNHEALLGRALIAAEAGEKGVARKYFQDALDAAPPAEVAERITQTIREL